MNGAFVHLKWTNAPFIKLEAVEACHTSLARPLWRLTRLTTPGPWSTTCHCWPAVLASGCCTMSAPLLVLIRKQRAEARSRREVERFSVIHRTLSHGWL